MIYKQIAQLFRGAFRKEKCELVLLAASAELADWAADSKLFSMEGASFIPYKKLFLKFILHIKTIIFELNTYSNLRAKPFRRCIQSFFVVYINLREIYEFINSNVYISISYVPLSPLTLMGLGKPGGEVSSFIKGIVFFFIGMTKDWVENII